MNEDSFSDALVETMDRFGIQGCRLSELSGISRNQISAIRNHKSVPSAHTLSRVLNGIYRINPQAYSFYFLTLMGNEDASVEHTYRIRF